MFRFLSELRATTYDPVHPKDPGLARVFASSNVGTAGVNITPDTALSLSGVWCAVTDISQKLAMLPFGLFETLGERRQHRTDDPRHRLLSAQPNRFQNSFEFREMMFSALLLRGLAVAEYVYDARGNITDIIPLHPDYAEPFRAPDGTIAYRDTYGGQRRILLADEVLAVRGFTVDGVTPLSPIKAAAMTLGVGAALDAFSGKYFENGTVIGGVLEGPAAMSDKAYQRLQDWTERHQGVGRAHKPAILEEGFKWTTASVSAEDAQLIEAKRYSLSDIARIYHFPLYKLAEMTQAKFANVEQQAIDYVGDTLQPVATRFEMAVNASLLSEEEQKTLYTKINLRGLLRGDSKQRGEFYQLMWSMGAYSPNRILELEDENPVEGGDARYVPVNYAEVGAEEQPDEEDTPATDGPNLEPFARDIAQRLLTAECKGVRKVLAAKAGEEGLADFYNAHHKMVQRALAPFGADVAQAYYLDVLNRVAQGVTLHDVGQWEQSRVQPDTNFILREARHAAAN